MPRIKHVTEATKMERYRIYLRDKNEKQIDKGPTMASWRYMMSEENQELPISADLLAILRDPAAVQNPDAYGPDPGQLELVHNSWLVSKDTGYKYPIKDGIPVMLIEEGERWKDTPIDELPMPPESAEPLPMSAGSTEFFSDTDDSGGLSYIALGAGLLMAILLAIGLWRFLSRNRE